jgi:hypothetical protein
MQLMTDPLSTMLYQFVSLKFKLVVIVAYNETLVSLIEYAYLPRMKMSCCPNQAGCALLIRLQQVPTEVIVRCLSIAQRAPILERES